MPRPRAAAFAFMRPDRFRFDYTKPFEQTIVADGKTLWLYDQDLNQVTSRSQAQALGSTPAALVASSASLAKLADVFELADEPDAQGMSWVRATPRQRDGQLKSVRVGFAQGELAVLDMEDGFSVPPSGSRGSKPIRHCPPTSSSSNRLWVLMC